MTNLPVTSSNSQPSTNAAVAPQKNSASDVQFAEPFGAVLARQIDEAGSAQNSPTDVIALDTTGHEAKVDPAISTGKGDDKNQDKTSATSDIQNDSAYALVAMLQLPQDIRTPVAKNAVNGTAPIVRDLSTSETAENQPAVNASTRIDIAKAAVGKADTTIAFADNLPKNTAVTGHTGQEGLLLAKGRMEFMSTDALRKAGIEGSGNPPINSQPSGSLVASTSSQNQIKPAEIPGTVQSTQNIAPPSTSMAASGIAPNMLTNSTSPDNPQTITSPLGSTNWTDEFSQKISWMSTQQNQVAELHLNPPDLGPLNVVIKISGDQATALFTSPHSAVRDAVESALPKLREILADNGIMLGNATVSDQSVPHRNAEGFMNQGTGTAAQREVFGAASQSAGSSPASSETIPARRHNGMIDTFA